MFADFGYLITEIKMKMISAMTYEKCFKVLKIVIIPGNLSVIDGQLAWTTSPVPVFGFSHIFQNVPRATEESVVMSINSHNSGNEYIGLLTTW